MNAQASMPNYTARPQEAHAMNLILACFTDDCRRWHRWHTGHCYVGRQDAYATLIRKYNVDIVLRHMPQLAKVFDQAERSI